MMTEDNKKSADDFDNDDGNEMEFQQSSELDFDDEDLLMDEEEDDVSPSVLYKGISKPKTEDDWRQLLLEASSEGVPEYQMSSTYEEGMLVLHTSFGLGVVSKVLTPRKMEMVFDLNKKLMAMGMTGS